MAAEPSAVAGSSAKRVVVCGGGVIGACAAYFLAENGAAHVTVIERSAVACAASGKAGGFLALDWCDGGPLGALARASFDLHRSLSVLLDGPRSYGYRPLTTLSLTLSTAEESQPSLPPWVDGRMARSPRTIGTTETTAQVHPQLFTRAILAAAEEKRRVEVVVGEVDRVEVVAGRAVGVVLKGGGGRFVGADVVVLALGPWSNRSPLISSLLHVSSIKAHSIVLRPRDPAAITPHALFLTYRPGPATKTLDPEVYPRPTDDSDDWIVPPDTDELVHDGEDLTWNQVEQATGANEAEGPTTRRRASTASASWLGRRQSQIILEEGSDEDEEDEFVEEGDTDSDGDDDGLLSDGQDDEDFE